MTYQLHYVSNMPDVVVGSLIAESSPLVMDINFSLKYQLWGLTRQLPKSAVVIEDSFDIKAADIDKSNYANYWACQYNDDYFYIKLLADILPGDYVGWAITDDKGQIYIARNSKPNEEQTLYFNLKHIFHEQR